MTSSSYYKELDEFYELFDNDFMEKIFWKILLKTPLGKVFSSLNSKKVDIRFLIAENDDDTFEDGRFAYISISNMIKLFETNSSSISYGLGFADLDDDNEFYDDKSFINLENLIIRLLKNNKINCTKSSSKGAYFCWEEGMFGSEVGFSLDFDFQSYFSESEIELIKNYKKEVIDEFDFYND